MDHRGDVGCCAARVNGEAPKRSSVEMTMKTTMMAGTTERRESDDAVSQKYSLEDFEIKNALGTGTFGRVVLVRHTPTKEYFALKILTIKEIIRLKQVEHVKSEKEILSIVKHPFIVNLLWTSHDSRYLYMLFEYLCGGELFTYLRNAGQFSDGTCLFYAAEIVSALDYLHSLDMVYRDLKPENLLLDKDGHLKLTDFGFAKRLDNRTWTLCGTPEYLAPEIVQNKGHNKAVDWWALGILIYEMLAGYPPFYDDNPFSIYDKILEGKIEWPKYMDPVAKDLIRKLLVQDRTRRLGNMKNGTSDVKNHRWFRAINWERVYNKKLDPPIVPRVRHVGDARNFYEYPDQNWQKWYEEGGQDSKTLSNGEQIAEIEYDEKTFDDF